jgi:hypothetical protein
VGGEVPPTIFRNQYIDVLKSSENKIVLGKIVDTALKGSVILFIDDFGLGDIVRQYILENVILS